MKILKKTAVIRIKWIVLIIAAWLMTSVGINRTANPADYFREDTSAINPLAISEDKYLRCPVTISGGRYLIIDINELTGRQLTINVQQWGTGDILLASDSFVVTEGRNSLGKIRDETKYLVLKDIKKSQISSLYQSDFPYIDLISVCKVLAGIVILILIQLCITYIKKRFVC